MKIPSPGIAQTAIVVSLIIAVSIGIMFLFGGTVL